VSETSKPKLTAAIPCYNQAHLLVGQLAAFAQQDYQPLEILLLDDGSTDATTSIMQSFCDTFPHARILDKQPNQGVIAALNRLVDEATGDYIICSAADDQVQPGMFSALMDCAIRFPQCGLVFCDTICEGQGRREVKSFGLAPETTYFPPEAIVEHYRSEAVPWIPGNATMWNRQRLIEVGKYRPELGAMCDFLPCWLLAFRYGTGYVPAPLAAYTVNDDTWSAQRRRDTVAYQESYRRLINVILSEECADVRALFKRSRVLCRSIWPFLPLVETGQLFNMMEPSDVDAISRLWTNYTLATAQAEASTTDIAAD
jgi:glycosyltransferase involved in cell wall biosynthesis